MEQFNASKARRVDGHTRKTLLRQRYGEVDLSRYPTYHLHPAAQKGDSKYRSRGLLDVSRADIVPPTNY